MALRTDCPSHWRIQDSFNGRTPNTKVGCRPIILVKFSQKLHEQGKNGPTLAPSFSNGTLTFAEIDKHREDCEWYRVNACCTQIWCDEQHIWVFPNEYSYNKKIMHSIRIRIARSSSRLLRGSASVHAGIWAWRPPPPIVDLETPHLWTEFLTHASENITLPQLRCGRSKYL